MSSRKVRKVLLIHSAHHASDGSVVTARRWIDRLTVANAAEMALPLIAAYTPPAIAVEMVDEYLDPVPLDTDADVIGISAQVMMLSRATELAKEFRSRGKLVVMGGFLPTMHPDLVEPYVDALCMGEGDRVWPRILADIEAGTLQRRYKADGPAPMDSIPTPRYDLIARNRLVSLPIQATRGCPYTCDYCSIIQFHEGRYRHRPVADIVRDFRAAGSRFVHFVDDNMMENSRFCRELFAELQGTRTLWGTQVTINVAKDPEMLKLAYGAGCRMLAVGVESLSQSNLDQMSKGFTQVDRFREAFRIIQDAGIGVHALIVFGFPEDTLESFDATVDFLESCGVAIAEFFIFTPYPKTPAGKAVWDAGLITDTDLSHFRESYVVFKHPTMSAHELYSGYWHAMRRFYSWKSIAKRLARGTMKDKTLHLAQNMNYWAKVKRDIVPVYFGRGNDECPTPMAELKMSHKEIETQRKRQSYLNSRL